MKKTLILISMLALGSCSYQQKLARAERKIERLTNKYPELKQDVLTPVEVPFKIPEYTIVVSDTISITGNITQTCLEIIRNNAPASSIVKHINTPPIIKDTLDVLIIASITEGVLNINVTKKKQEGVAKGEVPIPRVVIEKKMGLKGLRWHDWIFLIGVALLSFYFIGNIKRVQ